MDFFSALCIGMGAFYLDGYQPYARRYLLIIVKSRILRVSKKYCQMGMVFSYNEERVGFK